jgi:hypothetical protein
LQNFSFATATAEKRSFTARRAKNCKSLCKTNRVLQQAQQRVLFTAADGGIMRRLFRKERR